ncbi:MAG: hypothetical protein AB1757_16190 [Acidobacteriota bacterium]
MKYIRTILALLLTVFCGAGGGIFLTFTGSSLVGTYLYTAFPFAVAVLFIAIGLDVLGDLKRQASETKESQTADTQASTTTHHPKAA